MMTPIRHLLLAGATCAAVPVTAQVAPQAPPSQADISRARVGLPLPETPQFDLRIQSPERAAVPRAVDALSFTLDRITIEGATAIPKTEADAFFAPLLGRAVALEDVRAAAAKLEALYRSRGYFLTRVIIPPQRVADRTLTVRVIEGRLDAIDVQGLDAATQASVRRTLAPLLARTPIDLPSLERQLLLLNDIPGLAANGVLRPGGSIGTSTLVVTLSAPRTTLVGAVANTNSVFLGPWLYSASATINRPFGVPGAVNLAGGVSGPGFAATQSISGRYSTAVTRSGLIASVGGIYAEAYPKADLRALDIRNTLGSVSARLRYPVLRSRALSLFVEGGIAISRARTDVLGERLISDNTTVVDAGVIVQQVGWLGGTTIATANIFQAVPLFAASRTDAPLPSVLGFDADFTRLTLGLQRLQPIAPLWSMLLTAQGQLTRSKLLTGDQIAFGGPGVGRAYDPSQITGDRGIGASIEVRRDIPLAGPVLTSLQPFVFADAARATSIASLFGPEVTRRLASAGGGLRAFHRYGAIDVQLAHGFREFANDTRRRDSRVLVSLTFNN